jgi:hypothetical protein
MSEHEAIRRKIEQCERSIAAALDPLTTERLQALLAELRLELAKLL